MRRRMLSQFYLQALLAGVALTRIENHFCVKLARSPGGTACSKPEIVYFQTALTVFNTWLTSCGWRWVLVFAKTAANCARAV